MQLSKAGKNVLSKMYPRDYRVRESTWSEVVGVEMVPVEYPTRRRIHATRAGEEESKLARRGCSPGMVGMGQPGKEFGKLQATKHGTVLKLGCTHVSVFETERHGGAVPWSKAPSQTLQVSRANPGSLHRRPVCPSVHTELLELRKHCGLRCLSRLCQDSGEVRAASS